MDRVREAEAILMWGCAHVLDDRPWRLLPKNMLARMSIALDLPQIWEDTGVLSPFVADAVLDKFVRFSEVTDSRYLAEMTQGDSPSLTLELIRQSDACQFFQRKASGPKPAIITGSREPPMTSGWSVQPGGLGEPRSLLDQIRELVRELMSDSLRSICEPLPIPLSATPEGSGGSLSEQLERSVQSELELALAEASGSQKTTTSASGPAHRKSRPKRRRTSDSGSDSDGESDAEGNVIPADWPEDGTNIRRGVKAKWKLYIDKHRIPPSATEATVGGVDYDRDRVGPLVDLPRAAPGQYFRGRPGRS